MSRSDTELRFFGCFCAAGRPGAAAVFLWCIAGTCPKAQADIVTKNKRGINGERFITDCVLIIEMTIGFSCF
jgi:hypothetical protein